MRCSFVLLAFLLSFSAFSQPSSSDHGSASNSGNGIKQATGEQAASSIQICPNDSNDLIQLEGIDLTKTDIKMFDSQGRRELVIIRDQAIDVANLPTGMYYLILHSMGERIVKKIAVSH